VRRRGSEEAGRNSPDRQRRADRIVMTGSQSLQVGEDGVEMREEWLTGSGSRRPRSPGSAGAVRRLQQQPGLLGHQGADAGMVGGVIQVQPVVVAQSAGSRLAPSVVDA